MVCCNPGSSGLVREQGENSTLQAPSQQAWNRTEQEEMEESSKSLKASPLQAESMMEREQGASCRSLLAPLGCSLVYCKSARELVASISGLEPWAVQLAACNRRRARVQEQAASRKR